MSNEPVTRMRYYPKQFLRAQDFAAEQAYHLAMRRRHNIAHHEWGVVLGLELVEENGAFSVQPGVAIDGYGRELVVPQRRPLPGKAFEDKGRNTLDVWLVYDRQASDPAPPGYAGCGEAGQAARNRWREYPILRLGRPDDAGPDRRRPAPVPEGDLPFAPYRTPPDDPLQEWPVFLGQIRRERADPSQPFTYGVDMDDRPNVGLVGEAVRAPSGRAWLQIGAETTQPDRRFAVFIPEVDERTPRFEVDKKGAVNMRGATTMHGKLTMAGGAIALRADVASPQNVEPWTIYRYRRDDVVGDGEELRIQMKGGGGGKDRVVVGYWSEEEEAFVECFVVDNDCNVTIGGDLVVDGQITAAAFSSAGFQGDAQQFLLASALSGIGGAGALTGPPLAGMIGGAVLLDDLLEDICGSPAEQAQQLLATEEGRDALAAALVDDKKMAILLLLEIGEDVISDWLGLNKKEGPDV